MKRIAIIVLSVVLMESAWPVAGDKPTEPRAKPSSFIPHPRTNHHVYGAPIQPAIVGHAKTPHHKPTPKKPSSGPKESG